MSRQSGLVAGFISQLTTMLIFANGASALTAGETNSIVACVENDRAGQVTLNTRRRVPLPAPQVSYLPGADGEIIMTADFDGLAYNLPTRIIRLSGDSNLREKGIREIRIGQLQDSPPVSRISVVTGDARALKTISFKSIPGSLTVRWPAGMNSSLNAEQSARLSTPAAEQITRYDDPRNSRDSRVLADSRSRYRPVVAQQTPNTAAPDSNSETRQAPPVAPDFRKPRARANQDPNDEITTWSSSDLLNKSTSSSQSKRNREQQHKIAAGTAPNIATGTSRSGDIKEEGRGAQEEAETTPDPRPMLGFPAGTGASPGGQEWTEDKPPIITLSTQREPSTTDKTAAVFRLKIKSDHSLTYNTFRLSNPERYVIDFTNCPELVNAVLPDPQDSEFIRSVRVGQPDDASKTRLVIDLINEPVAIKEQVQREASTLTIRLSRAVEAADTAATQIAVPTGTVIVLDAGHGGSDPGAQRGDVQEKEITLDIIERLRKRLEARGFRVTLTRSDDTFVSLEDRVRITNNLQPTLFLSVHINAMESANDIHGIETYYQTEQSRALADTIHENLVTKLDAPDRAVRKARFYVINHTPVPAVLAEVGFISNKDERDKLISSDYQGKVAAALEQGVMLYLDKQLARVPSESARTSDSARNSSLTQTGTMKVGERSNNTRIAQRKYQFEDAAR